MNKEILNELINRYEANLEIIYDKEKHNELFKWRAVQCWQREWIERAGEFSNFAERFSAARREFLVLIDNSRMHSSTGVLKLWEHEPESVEALFTEVLFADCGEDVAKTQNQMDKFLEEYEKLREKHFPTNWSYKQSRNSASVFLAVNSPDKHYIFKSSEARQMAQSIEFGFDIGTGANFSLPNYYRMCNEIAESLRERKSLLEKHYSYLDEHMYRGESLNLLVYDLIYCSRTYNYYKGLVSPASGKIIKKKNNKSGVPAEEKLAEIENERKTKIEALEDELAALERLCDRYEDISLLGVQVHSSQYGVGTVIEQNINIIKVRFLETVKSFKLDKRIVAPLVFENDEEIIEVFTEYGRANDRIKSIKKRLANLQ